MQALATPSLTDCGNSLQQMRFRMSDKGGVVTNMQCVLFTLHLLQQKHTTGWLTVTYSSASLALARSQF